MGQLRMGELLDGDICSAQLSGIFNNIGCIDEKWGINKGNETKSEEKEGCKGRAHGDEMREGCSVQTRSRRIDEDENWTDVEGLNEKSWSELKFTIIVPSPPPRTSVTATWMEMILEWSRLG